MTLKKLQTDIRRLASPKKAKILARFFKTGKGEYGEGDVFLGITVPDSRKIAVKYNDLSFSDIKKLLQSKIHEERLIGLLILVHNYNNGSDEVKENVFKYYIQNTKYINNWDLVDVSADLIIGDFLLDNGNTRILHKLAQSKNLWERRIAIISTWAFIKHNKSCKETFEIAKILLNDKHDLIQKAVGWMLREVGKRISQDVEETFLREHYKHMSRTSLRYALEHFPLTRKIEYLQ